MRNEIPGNDLRTIWQSQPTEPTLMTLETIRLKTQELHAKTRRALLRGAAASLLVVGIAAYGFRFSDGPIMRFAFALAIAWSLAGQYFANRGMRSTIMPINAALSTDLRSYAQEVERRRSLSARFFLWSFGPVLFAIGNLVILIANFGIRNRGILVEETLSRMVPFLTLLVIWIVSVFVIRLREQRELQRDIHELSAFESANG